MRTYDITNETPPDTFIKAAVGEKFSIRMPDVRGRIIEPGLGQYTVVDHTCRTEGGGFVEFDMIALKPGTDLVEFPLIEDDWDGESDPDPEKAEPYACILVVVLQKRRRGGDMTPIEEREQALSETASCSGTEGMDG
jgi:hypothetical protein